MVDISFNMSKLLSKYKSGFNGGPYFKNLKSTGPTLNFVDGIPAETRSSMGGIPTTPMPSPMKSGKY